VRTAKVGGEAKREAPKSDAREAAECGRKARREKRKARREKREVT